MVRYTKSGVSYTARPTGNGGKATRRAQYQAGRPPAYTGAVNYSQVRQIAPTETKYFDTAFQQNISAVSDWTGTEVPCTGYIQSDGATVGMYTDSALIPSAIGAGYGQINGNKYYLKKLRIRAEIKSGVSADQADVAGPNTVRLVVLMDTQPQGSQAQGESVFTDMGASAQTQHSFLAMAAGSGGRFRVLKDKTFMLNPMVAGTDGANTNSIANGGAMFKCNYNWRKPLAVQLKANSAVPTVASLSNFNIFMLVHSSQTAPTYTINGCSRAYYTD